MIYNIFLMDFDIYHAKKCKLSSTDLRPITTTFDEGKNDKMIKDFHITRSIYLNNVSIGATYAK